jgi:SseB protein N-terminal domain/SseB protein C-terminal domain
MYLGDNSLGRQNSPRNPELERAMQDVAKHDNPATRESLYQKLLGSTFLLEGSFSRGSERPSDIPVVSDHTRIAFKTVEYPPGNVLLPVFTDEDALISWAGSEAQWIALSGRALFQAIAPSKIAEVRINPFRPGKTISRSGGAITRHEFMALAQGLLPTSTILNNVAQLKVAVGQKLYIAEPSAGPPGEVVAKLAEYFRQIAELQSAYLFLMTNRNVRSNVIGLHFAAEPDAKRMEQIVQGAGNLVRGEASQGLPIDFMPLKAGPFLDSVKKCARELIERR